MDNVHLNLFYTALARKHLSKGTKTFTIMLPLFGGGARVVSFLLSSSGSTGKSSSSSSYWSNSNTWNSKFSWSRFVTIVLKMFVIRRLFFLLFIIDIAVIFSRSFQNTAHLFHIVPKYLLRNVFS